MKQGFKVLGEIREVETIASGRGVLIRRYLDRVYGKARWRKKKGIATVELADGTICEAEIHWYQGPEGFQNQTGAEMSDQDYVLCINNDSNPASLMVGKVYRRLPDPEALARHMVRIIDEDQSEPEGYLYPAWMFSAIELKAEAKEALMAAKVT